MLARELEQHADDLVLHQAQPLGAAPALAVAQQHLFGMLASPCKRDLHPLRDGATQFLLAAGVLVGDPFEIGRERIGVEQIGAGVAGLVEGQHADIRIAEGCAPVTARCTLREKQRYSKWPAPENRMPWFTATWV